ncbi:ComEC/Rec2 family competence protein [Pseudarthrobacter enclensis]|uniref:ComEC/Rec2 family competence protein n=1 Tax=Pseudarthrobacter enclensis TaxID=993070 RepID=UPI003EE08256
MRRTDVRLAVPAALVWAAAVAGLWLEPAPLLGLCLALTVVAACLLFLPGLRGPLAGGARFRGKGLRRSSLRGRGLRHRSLRRPVRRRHAPVARRFTATVAVGLLLAVAAAAHSAAAASQRFEGPLAEAIQAGKTVVAVLEVAGTPRPLGGAGPAAGAARWSVPVWTREVSTGGALLRTRAQLVVTGGVQWEQLVPGQIVRAAGKLRPPEPGRPEAGGLSAATGPDRRGGAAALQSAATDLRARFVKGSAFLAGDAAGLLPGMVTGDTSALDDGLGNAMKVVGMTHLTAVSGANCSLVLGALLLLCRRLRLPRAPAAAAALSGLGLFVVLVGPDPSVLRAALMGAVGVASIAGGRTGRGLSFLCVAVIGLLLLDPALGGSFGFLLSVLATLGIITVGRSIMDWTPAAVPRWISAAVAVPLSAQLMCSPVIILLQPQFSTYALVANVVAAPLVAPVTLLGTAAVPLLVALPWLATALMGAAGIFSGGVAATARFFAGLPGSSLPWPEGVPGMATMVLLSALTLFVVKAVAGPAQAVAFVLTCHGRIERSLFLMETRAAATRRQPAPSAGRDGIDHSFDVRRRHDRLKASTNFSGRNPPWLLRKSAETARRRRIPPPGAT